MTPADAEREHQEAFGGGHVLGHTGLESLGQLVGRVRDNDPSLTKLEIYGNDFLANRELHLSDLALELLGRYVAANTHLEHIDLGPLRDNNSLLFNNLTGSSSLKSLELAEHQFGLEGIRSMIPFLSNAPNLSMIILWGNENICSECFEAVVHALNGGAVEILDFTECSITSIAALENVTLPHLRELYLPDNSIERVPSLGHLSNLQKLSLGGNNMHTMPPIEMLTNLERLDMNGNQIGNKGCKEIAKLLRSSHCSLEYLHLRRNAIGEEGARIIADSLKNNYTLVELWLDGNELNEDGYRAFSKLLNDVSSVKSTLASNHTLRKLFSARPPMHTNLMQQINNAFGINEQYEGNPSAAGREKVIATWLSSLTRRELCVLQGVEYSYGSIFGGIDPILLPNLLALASGRHGQTELYLMLVATASDVTSLRS